MIENPRPPFGDLRRLARPTFEEGGGRIRGGRQEKGYEDGQDSRFWENDKMFWSKLRLDYQAVSLDLAMYLIRSGASLVLLWMAAEASSMDSPCLMRAPISSIASSSTT